MFVITPDSTNSLGRPYPYMIYRNMEALELIHPWTIIKVGDTNSDIMEGLNAGVWTVGVIVGSSNMGLSEKEYNNLSEDEKAKKEIEVTENFKEIGADFTIKTMRNFQN